MKRRIIYYVLFVVMILSMTGCKSQDYLKAVDLFESGQYSQAGEVFANLEDYEDSSQLAGRFILSHLVLTKSVFADTIKMS